MNALAKAWLTATTIGLNASHPSSLDRTRVRILNTSLMVAFALCLLLGINAYFAGRETNALIQFARCVCLAGCYLLSSKSQHNFAFTGLIATLLLSSLAFLVFYPYNVGNSYVFFSCVILVFYFVKNTKKATIYCLIISFLGIAYYYIEETQVPSAPAEVKLLAYALVLLIMVLILRRFDLELEKDEAIMAARQANLKKANEELAEKNKQFEQLNLELHKLVQSEQRTSLALEMSNAELVNMQEQLLHAEKIDSSARLVKGVVEQLSNPLNFVFGGVNAMIEGESELSEVVVEYQKLQQLSDLAKVPEKLAAIRELEEEIDFTETVLDIRAIMQDTLLGAKQISDFLHELTYFTEPISAINIIATDPALIFQEELEQRPAEQQSIIHLEIEADFPQVQVSQPYLRLILNHLVDNSLEAKSEQISIKVWTMGKKWAFSVEDSGTGISETIRKGVTEPFFTTKFAPHKGTGLAVVSHAVRQHRGSLEIQSKEGKGTQVFVALPISQDTQASSSLSPLSEHPAT